jgi:ABC-type branched-subunit amino acid transport system substrate-binding protein
MTQSRSAFFRLLAVLFVLLLVGAACGRDDEDGDVEAGQDTEEGGGGGEGKEPSPVPGFDGKTIKVGVLTPLTGRAAQIGIPLTDGNKVWFEHVNAQGGIAGKYKIEPVIEDTVYDNPTTIQKYNKIKGDVVMFAQILGTPPTNAVLPNLKQDNIVASPASLDAEWIKEPNLLPLGGPYQVQFINAAHYLINEAQPNFKGKNFCIIAEEGPYGDAGIEGLEFAGKELDFEIKATARFKATDQDFTAQVTQLKNAACDAVFVTSLPTNLGQILGTGARLGFSPQWVGQSPTWATQLGASPQVGPLLQKFMLAAEGTAWGDTSVEGMKQLLDDIAKFKPDQKPDIYFSFGYLEGRAVTTLLEKAVELGDLSRDGIKKALAELGDVDYAGLSGEYTYGAPADRNPPRQTTIFRVDAAAAATGFLKVAARVESDAAKEFEFEKK